MDSGINWKLIGHLLTRNGLTHEERHVALILAYCRNSNTLRCDPTQATIAKRTRLKQQRVSRIIGKLRKKNVIETIQIPNHESPWKKRLQYYFLYDINKVQCLSDDLLDTENLECVRIKLAHCADLQHISTQKCV